MRHSGDRAASHEPGEQGGTAVTVQPHLSLGEVATVADLALFVVGLPSLIPRPSPAPVYDHLQYAKTEGEGLVNLTS